MNQALDAFIELLLNKSIPVRSWPQHVSCRYKVFKKAVARKRAKTAAGKAGGADT
jgi:hypothetical protein